MGNINSNKNDLVELNICNCITSVCLKWSVWKTKSLCCTSKHLNKFRNSMGSMASEHHDWVCLFCERQTMASEHHDWVCLFCERQTMASKHHDWVCLFCERQTMASEHYDWVCLFCDRHGSVCWMATKQHYLVHLCFNCYESVSVGSMGTKEHYLICFSCSHRHRSVG